jgi:stage II sporulation protein AA (anti-sigma F factor antagonist)
LSTPSEFDVVVDAMSPGVAVVRVLGELDLATCERIEEAFTSAASAPRVIVDLTGCTFLDSSGVRVLVTAHRDASTVGGGVELVASDPNILRVLEITSLNTVLTVHSTLEAAL